MKTMTPKERMDAALKGQPTDRTPFCLVDGGAWIAKMENLSYRELYGSRMAARQRSSNGQMKSERMWSAPYPACSPPA